MGEFISVIPVKTGIQAALRIILDARPRLCVYNDYGASVKGRSPNELNVALN